MTKIVVGLLLLLIVGSLAITIDGLHDQLHHADLCVVLGSKVERDGTPSPALQARLDHACNLYRQGYFNLVLVSGAHGKEGYDEPKVMRHYLETQGIPTEIILEDNEGGTTWETAKNTARILSDRHLKSVLIVSQYFHIARCRLAFSKCGIAPIYTSHAPHWSLRDFYSVPREVAGYIWYYFR
jgi:vancomycin permeability regulator SanA